MAAEEGDNSEELRAESTLKKKNAAVIIVVYSHHLSEYRKREKK